jgi:hypothetical protein
MRWNRRAYDFGACPISAPFGEVGPLWTPGLMISAIALLAVWYLAKH